jgi:hypothetical protein
LSLSLRWREELPPVSAQHWLPVDRPVRLLEVGSIHLRLKTPQERRRIRRAEEELFNGLRFPVQRIALPVPLDLTEYLDGLYDQAGADRDRHRAWLLSDKADHVSALVHERHLVQWRNLVVIPADGPNGAERVQYLRTGLERMGLAVAELDRAGAAQVWYELLNPDQAAIDRLGPDTGLRSVLDRITPIAGFDFGQHSHFRIGRKLCRVLCGRDFPRTVTMQQFQDTYRIDRRVTVIQHVHPASSDGLQREISNSIGEMNARLAGPLTEYEREALKARLRDAHRLLRKLAGENHQVLDFCLYVLVRAESLEELDLVCRTVTSRFDGKGMRVRPVHFWQHEDGFRCCLPACLDPLREFTRRNVPAASVPATFPYANAELSHGQGVVAGVNKDTGNLVIVDPWLLMNPHSAFIGFTGAGKTFTLNELVIQFWSRGIQIRSLDIEGDKGRLCHELKGQRVRIAPHAGNYLNPMEVRRPALDPTLFLDGEAEEPANGLAATIQRELILFGLLLPSITPVELAKAETLLIQCYRQFGIDFDSDFGSIHPQAWPTWRDLHPLLADCPETERLAAVMQSWVQGSLAGMFDRHTSVDLDNQYVLLDIHDVMGHRLARGPVFFQAMTFLWDEINRDWRERKILDIDELGILADSEDALEFVWRVSKCARRRNCRLQVATQDPADFLSGRNPAALKYALGIINNCATKVLGYLEPKALEQVAQAVRLSEAEIDLLSRIPREEKLVICGEQRAHVEVVASLEELRILDPQRYAGQMGQVT